MADKSGWLKRDMDAARREVKEYPPAIRPYLDGSYRPLRNPDVQAIANAQPSF